MAHGMVGKKNAKKTVTADAHLHGRCYKKDKDRWIKQAQNEGLKLMPWVVNILNEACDISELDKNDEINS